jgi:hypothetical protein
VLPRPQAARSSEAKEKGKWLKKNWRLEKKWGNGYYLVVTYKDPFRGCAHTGPPPPKKITSGMG